MVKAISKAYLIKLRDKQRSEMITKINEELKKYVNKLINGYKVNIDMSTLEITKATTDFIIDHYLLSDEWEIELSKEKSINPEYSDVLTFKLI